LGAARGDNAGVDASSLRQALLRARVPSGGPLVLPGEINDVAIEGAWAAVVLGREAQSPSWLEQVWLALKAAFPDADIEVRAGLKVYKGGLGFGDGKHVVAVLGGKGGVGKSTISLNLALTFAAMGLRTGLLDADLAGPDIPHMLGVHPIRITSEITLMTSKVRPPSKREKPQRRYEMQVASVGFGLAERRFSYIAGHNYIALVLRYLLFEVGWDVDVLVIDSPPGTGSEIQIMARELPLSGALFVTTPQDLAQMDAGRTLTLLEEAGVPVIGMVHNMASLTCPHCGEAIDMFAASRRMEDEGVPIVGRIPFDINLARTADQGLPLVLGDPRGPVAYEFARIAAHARRWLREEVPRSRGPDIA
jgi:ATP-binding protein involved in chromosome partitioning